MRAIAAPPSPAKDADDPRPQARRNPPPRTHGQSERQWQRVVRGVLVGNEMRVEEDGQGTGVHMKLCGLRHKTSLAESCRRCKAPVLQISALECTPMGPGSSGVCVYSGPMSCMRTEDMRPREQAKPAGLSPGPAPLAGKAHGRNHLAVNKSASVDTLPCPRTQSVLVGQEPPQGMGIQQSPDAP